MLLLKGFRMKHNPLRLRIDFSRLFVLYFIASVFAVLILSRILVINIFSLNEDQEVIALLIVFPMIIGLIFMLLLFSYQRLSKQYLPTRFILRYALPGFTLPLIVAMSVATNMPIALNADGIFDELHHVTRFFDLYVTDNACNKFCACSNTRFLVATITFKSIIMMKHIHNEMIDHSHTACFGCKHGIC